MIIWELTFNWQGEGLDWKFNKHEPYYGLTQDL